MIRAVDWMDKGLTPNGGGWMNETQQFLDAADFTRSEKAAVLAALNK